MENKNIQNEEFLENVETKPKDSPKTKIIAKKFVGITLLLALVAVIVTVAVLAFVPKDYNFGFNDPVTIEMHTADSSSPNNKRLLQKDSEEYNEIMKLYKESFGSKVLTSLLQGKLNRQVEVTEGYKSISSLTGPYLVFCYESSQKLVLNGKEYKAEIVSDSNFIEVVVEVKNTTNLTEINAYFKYRDTGLNNYSYVRFSTLAAQSNLYNYIENLW